MFENKIWVEKGFQTSVNIAYDLHNDDKIKNFIPTTSAIDVIEDIMLSTSVPDRGRARMLVGAYGRGKSHIILMLMSLLFKKDISLFDTLLNKINVQNPKLYNFIIEYVKSDKKLLPIIVSGSSTSITQSFLSALQFALNNEKLSDLMPETNFKAAISTIERWKKDYPDTYKKLVDEINIPIDDFVIELKQYDVPTYEKFEKLYPVLTSGGEFNPFVGFDVVELYEKVIEKLKDRGFCGVYIVYDEFSKYLECSMSNATISDIKLLQDFAEKCERSGDKQMHLMLISHKDIANYIDNNLPKEKVDGWKGVSGRFKHIHLHNNFSQMYEIISAVIKKEPSFWESFLTDNENRFNDLVTRFTNNGILDKSDADIADIAVRGCYPLHPISTFILPRLSEKVAQNERTLFTFLSADNNYTLTAFLENAKGDFPILTPDLVYDYFEPLLRKEPYTSEIHKLYETTYKVLQKIDSESFAAKIVKTISLIYIVEQFEKLPPIKDMLIAIFKDVVSNIDEINETLSELIEKDCIVYLKRSNGFLKLKESSGVDIGAEIADVINKTKHTLSVKNVLNEASFDSFMYPTAYNDEMEITRYFDFTFIDSNEFFAVDNWSKKIEDLVADGVVYAIIPSDKEDLVKIRTRLKSNDCNHDRILFVVSEHFVDIEKIAFEYNAVKLLKSNVADDDLLSDEYDIYIEDLEEVISKYINSFTKPELGLAEYYWNGERQQFKRRAQISAKLSEICEAIYAFTPIINNESLNKDVLPTVAINSRNKILNGLLENELSANLGLTGTGQEVSFMRSALIQTGILQNKSDYAELNLTPSDTNMSLVLRVIKEFFEATDNQGKSLGALYKILTEPQIGFGNPYNGDTTLPSHGYGLKKGVIPIYIAVVLHAYKKHTVVKSKGEELRITVDLLNSINESPNDFTLYREDWNDEKAAYIENLEELFSDYVIQKEKDYGTFTYIVSAMSRWYMSLPKYAKEMKKVYKGNKKDLIALPKEQVRFITSLKQGNINAHDYLFGKVFDIYGYKEFRLGIVDNIKSTKNTFDSAKNGLIKHLILDIKTIFRKTDAAGATLPSIAKDFIEQLKSSTLNYLFPDNEHVLLQLMTNIGNDEKTFVERVAKAVTNLRLDDWTSDTITTFIADLEVMKKNILEYDRMEITEKSSSQKVNGYMISFVGADGQDVVRTFEKTEYSKRGKLLYNEIANALDEMGTSITEQEKRQILMEFIEKMC